jgi:S1-C subfamily serine protease
VQAVDAGHGEETPMTLTNLYYHATPCVVGFISRFKVLPANTPPLFPDIFGTGFLVDDCGTVVTNRHVVEVFDQVPRHPERKESPVAAIIFFFSEDRLACQMAAIEPQGSTTLGQFVSSGDWFGQAVPDVAFVQLKVRETPFLKLATADFYVDAGMEIATIGYPLGTAPLTALGKLNQVCPFIRRGIVSSVLPFPTRHPHGFTIDIMQQGGSSGSPIFSVATSEVVGMMFGGVIEPRVAQSESVSLTYTLNTNISLAEPAHVIQEALAAYKRAYPPVVSDFPTLAELRAAHPKPSITQDLTWDVWPVNP